MNQLLAVFITGIFASTGLWGFLTALLQKRAKDRENESEILKAIADLKKDIEGLKEDRERDNADSARNYILRFDDELRRHVEHSEEFFNQILDYVNYYQSYCDTHDSYPNSKAESAMAHIKACYQKCKDEDRFI